MRLARKLRATLEHAANVAEESTQQDARALLIQHTPDISTLACLTEAVRGGYTLDSYDDFTQQSQQQQQARQEEVDRAREVLDEHAANMAQEAESAENEEKASKPAAAAPKKKEPAKKQKAKKQKTVKKAVKDRAKAPPRAPPTHALTARPSRAAAAKPNYDSIYQESPESPEFDAKRITTKSGRRQGSTKQCHDCKSSTTQYQRCRFWFPTGTQCGKIFCRKCIELKYEGVQDNWEARADLSDWQ